MKYLAILLITILILFTLLGCSSKRVEIKPGFKAYVVDAEPEVVIDGNTSSP